VNKEKQKKYDTMYMDVARRISEMSHCNRRQVGAIIVSSGNIISFGWNGQPAGTPNGCEDDNNVTFPTVIHAEHNAIKKIQDTPPMGDAATLFVTMNPCLICAEIITNFGIKRVVYEERYRFHDGIDYLIQNGVVVEQITTQNH
jgi:dCMP deaminase